MAYTSNHILKYITLPKPYNYIEFLYRAEDRTEYFRLGIERGEDGIILPEDFYYDYEKIIKIQNEQKYLKIYPCKNVQDISDIYKNFEIVDELSEEEIMKVHGYKNEYEYENQLTIYKKVRNSLYNKFSFNFKSEVLYDYVFDSQSGYYDKAVPYPDTDAQAFNQEEREKLHLVKLMRASSGYAIYYGIKLDEKTDLDIDDIHRSDGLFITIRLSDFFLDALSEDVKFIYDNSDTTSLYLMEKYYIEVDEKIRKKYTNCLVEPISLSYGKIFYSIVTSNGTQVYIEYGLDDNIYEIKSEKYINYISSLKESELHKHIIRVIKFRCNEFHQYSFGNDIEINDEEETYEIPYGTYKIEEFAFSDYPNIKKIVLPDTITRIKDYAFCDCKSLESINIPDGVVSIGKRIFDGCNKLVDIKISDSLIEKFIDKIIDWKYFSKIVVPEGRKCIYEYEFENYHKLQEVVLPNTIESIEDGAFQNCEKLERINLPINLNRIGYSAFKGCSSLKEVVLPDSLNYIDLCAFEGCNSLVRISQPISTVFNSSFNECHGLKEIIIRNTQDDPSFVYSNFSGCNNVENITIHDNSWWGTDDLDNFPKLKSLEFKGNEEIVCVNNVIYRKDLSVIIKYLPGKEDNFFMVPESVKEFLCSAFRNCQNLESIFLSEHTISILGSFCDFPNLKEFHVKYTDPEYVEADFSGNVIKDITLFVPKGTLQLYRNHPVFSKFKEIIEE